MTTLERLGADDLRLVVVSFRDALRAHQEGINKLNVYPVPDGDTGTNMALTMESVVRELETAEPGMAAICKAMSHGSLMGARGNSGVILSQILRGLAEEFGRADGVDSAALSAALTSATKGAYGAVMKPVEGTILTVVREAAEAAEDHAGQGEALVDVLDAARISGHAALDRTPELLPVLAAAGVVDAGGTGFLLLIDAMLHVAAGRPLPEASVTEAVAERATVTVGHGAAGDQHGDHGDGDISGLRYEVMYFLEAPDETVPALKDVWAGIGDSIVVVGGDGLWNCHIHTDDIGAAIEAALDCGRPRDIRVTDLLEQVEEERWVREGSGVEEPPPPAEPVTTAVVAIATGEGIRRIFHSLGVQSVVAGGQSMNPSTAQILEAVERSPADRVVILPNNKNIIPVAEQVDDATAKHVRVVPTRGIAEGFAALLQYDPEADLDDNVDAMADAAANVVAGEVTRAVRDSMCEVGPIAEGDFLGIGRLGIRSVAPTSGEATIALLTDLLTEDHEILTLIEGEGATAGETRRITEWLSEHHAHLTCEVHHGGQPLYPYFLGIE
jgi:DAK2 domain fusion protein YloV